MIQQWNILPAISLFMSFHYSLCFCLFTKLSLRQMILPRLVFRTFTVLENFLFWRRAKRTSLSHSQNIFTFILKRNSFRCSVLWIDCRWEEVFCGEINRSVFLKFISLEMIRSAILRLSLNPAGHFSEFKTVSNNNFLSYPVKCVLAKNYSQFQTRSVRTL